MLEPRVHYKLFVKVASITCANYCPDAYLIMLVVRCLLTTLSTQKAAVLVDHR